MKGGVVALALWGALSGSVQAQEAAPDQIEAGRRLYVMSCQRCHGINLVSNSIGFDLRTFPQHDKARFVRSVNEGLRAMPAWAGVLKPGQMELLWAYVGAVNRWEAGASAPK
jgi:mono/diheme cytochrome c family protein